MREEFARRGLEPPLIEEEDAPIVSQPELVTVARYRDLAEAFVAKAVLDQAGIECLLRDANTVRMDWFLSNAVGGMRLQVAATDEAAARALLSQPIPQQFATDSGEEFQQPVCPKCGSLDIMANDTDRKIKLGVAWALPLSAPLLAGLPALAMLPKTLWKCNRCGCNWSDDGDRSDTVDNPLR
ncbi:MAG TPA: DUF2007 domain-containing protein [Acidobacteriaceae bacterium]